MTIPDLQLVMLAMLGGMLRISPALLWVAIGDCLTQRSGNFNFGLEGIVAVGAVTAVVIATATGDPWLGVLGAATAGFVLALAFTACCVFSTINSITVGIAFFVGGLALARFAGADLLAVGMPNLPVLDIGWFAEPTETGPLQISIFLIGGLVLACIVGWILRETRLGLLVTATGSSNAAAGLRAIGSSHHLVRTLATAIGGACGGIGGACLATFYPGGWSDNLANGVGLTALTLVFLAGSRPALTALLVFMFAAAAALGPALQVLYGTGSYHLLNALPFICTLIVMIYKVQPKWQILR